MRSKVLSLQAIAIPALAGKSQGLLVALHGWGANARDLATLAPYLALPDYQFIFPDAPLPHPHAPGGRMWYGFPTNYDFQSHPNFDAQPDLMASRQQLLDWLQSLPEITGIPLSRTVLGGFSQGGAMTLDVGFRLPLAALMVLSGYLHAPIHPPSEKLPPVLMVHGRQDQVVPITAARQSRDRLIAAGVSVQYEEFDMGHEIQPVVLKIMQSFMGEGAFHLGEIARNDLG